MVPIDQAEELFAAENTEAERMLEHLAEVVRADRDTIILATIRSDAFEKLQNEPRLAEVRLLPFSLARLPHGAFKEVIEGPARLANPKLAIEPALTERLLIDLATGGDALPLLAFTLQRLWLRHRGGRTLTLAEYTDDLGGLQGVIESAVDAAFAEAQRDPALPHERVELEQLARTALIPALVHLDEADGEPSCRVERLNALPERALSLVHHLVDQRLLIRDRNVVDGIATDTIEVAHEAILRQWPALRSWIAEERDALRALDGVRGAAREWREHRSSADRGKSWLVHGSGRLEEAEQLLAPAHFAGALQPFERDYLLACRTRDNADRDRERSQVTREKKNIARTQRLQRNVFVVIGVAVAMLLFAGFGFVELLRGAAIRSSDVLAKLSEQASDNQDYEAAARYAIAGLADADWAFLGYSGRRAEVALKTAAALSRRIAVLRGHGGPIHSAAYSPDGMRIVTASRDRTARIWDVRTGAQIAVLRGHGGVVHSAAYNPDGTRVVTASYDKTARIWDAHTGTQIAVLRGHDGEVTSAAYSPDGTRIVTASRDNTGRIWDARTGVQIAILRGHDDLVDSAAYSPDGTRIVTTSFDKTARIWDARTGAQIAVLRGHEGDVNIRAYSPDGTRIVTASDDKTARIWNARTGAQIAVLHGHDSADNSVAYSPDGSRIVTASDDKTARIWDARTGAQIAVVRGHDGALYSAAYSPDGTRLVTTSFDNTARIWNAHTGAQITVLRGHDGALDSAAYSPDGTRLVTASADKTARIWNARTGAQITVLRGHDDYVYGAAYSPNGTRIVTASRDKTAHIWDAHTGAQIAVLRGHDDAVHSAAYSPDGTRILTASYDKTARIWNPRTGAQVAVLRGHDGDVNSAAYSRDGTRIVTASRDKTTRIWDAHTGAQIAILRGHDDAVTSAAYSPDGTRIITASRDNTANIWKSPRVQVPSLFLSSKPLIDYACTSLLSGGLDHFSAEELAAAPDLDPKLHADACHPPTLWERLREMILP